MQNNNLRYGTILFAALALMLVLVNTVSANGELSITSLSITPQPVVAGDNITIAFQLYDSYSTIQNVNLQLTGAYPLLNYSPLGSEFISSIGQGVYGGTGSYFEYHLKIPQNVQAGTYTVYVSATYLISTVTDGQTSTSTASSSMPISFYISGTPSMVLSATPTSPVAPGSLFTVNIAALNSGTTAATNVSLTLMNSNNFSVSGSSVLDLGTIQASATGSSSTTIQANRTLSQGASYIPVNLKYTSQYGQNITKLVNVPLSIVVSQPTLVPSIVSTQPETLYSGSNQTLSVAIQNVGTGTAKNVTVKFLSTPNLTVGGSASDIFIGGIASGSSATESVFIIANRYDNQTNYRLPVQLSYTNANYQNTTTKTQYLNITLQKSANFNITNVSSSITPGGTYVPVTFTVKNIGAQTAQQVTFSMQTIFPISPVNPNVYVKTLAPGQSTNVTFYVDVQSTGNPGQYPVSIYEQWSQANGATNQQYSASSNYYVPVLSSGPGIFSATNLIILVVIIVIIVAIVLYRRRTSKKAAPKAK